MGFNKGHEKSGGRTKGTPNKISKEVKDLLKVIVLQELEQAEGLLEELSPKDRLHVLVKLLPYVIPKELEIVSETYNLDRPPTWFDGSPIEQ
jgi:hypothetical protein